MKKCVQCHLAQGDDDDATQSNKKNVFAVLFERLTPLTTFIN